MAKVNFTEVPPELQEKFNKVVMPNDRYFNSRIVKKNTLLSKPRKSAIKVRSYLPMIKDLWNAKTPEEKALWSAIRPYSGYTGYSSFVQEQNMRIKNGHPGEGTPSIHRNGKCGFLVLTWPDSELKLFQAHPIAYFISKKKAGTKGQYDIVRVNEILNLPLTISISYKSDLTATEEPFIARFYAKVISNYQGRDIETIHSVDFELQSDWQRLSATLSNVRGVVRSYAVYIHLKNVIGVLKFDNVIIEHSGQNWARDKRCNNISQQFTRQYFNVPKHWIAEYEGVNTTFYSDYHEEEI
jgi:hypothetical protein